MNNAGGQFPAELAGISAKGWQAVIANNLTGGFLMARECYRLRPAGWWGSLGLMLLLGASSGWTLVRSEPERLFRAMGYPEDELRAIESSGFADPRLLVAVTALMTLLSVVYLLAIRRYFARQT